MERIIHINVVEQTNILMHQIDTNGKEQIIIYKSPIGQLDNRIFNIIQFLIYVYIYT